MVEPKQVDHDAIVQSLVRRTETAISVRVVDELASTNSQLVNELSSTPVRPADAMSPSAPQVTPSVLVARCQTAGKGRAGRSWVSSGSGALTFSIHLKVNVPLGRVTWLPLIVGSAVAQVLSRDFGVPAVVKWPNDILLSTELPDLPQWLGLRKLGGILVERVNTDDFVVGIGLNVGQTQTELPVETAISLSSAGYGNLDPNELLAALISEVLFQVEAWQEHDGDPEVSGVRALAEEFSVTLGSHVSAELAGKEALTGEAIGFGESGELQIRKENGECLAFSAGDVSHLRLR